MRTTNNLVFASLDAYKTTIQHAKENTKQNIFDINSKTAKTFAQNSKELTAAAQDSASRFNASVNSGNGSSNTGTTSTTYTSVA